jgi:putative transposase
VHSTIRKTPFTAWQEGIAQRKQPLRYPSDAEEFFQDFLPAVPRLVQRDGIHFHTIRYWHSVLSPWAGRLKEPLLVKYDPRNLSRVYVRDPSGKHWPIPYADLGNPPIALWELTEARKRLRQHSQADATESALFANVLQQRRLVKEAAKRSQQRRRQERIPLVSESETPNEAESKDGEAASDIEPYPVEIWDDE